MKRWIAGLALSLLATSAGAVTPAKPPVHAPAKPLPNPAQVVAPAAQPAPVLPFPQAMILIRSSLLALQQADETGDYDVLYGLGAKSFQQANPPQKLSQTFAAMRPYNINSVLVLEPEFTQVPVLDKDGLLIMAGYFNGDGYRINFQLAYQPENDHWKLFGISAGVQPVPPAAPAAPAKGN